MTDTAVTMVEQMIVAGERPEPQLLEAILAHGQAVLPPLLDVVRRDAHGWPEEAPLYHAIGLLSMLRAPEAIPALLDLFHRYDNETLEGLPRALTPFGTAVVEPLLAILQNSSLHWYSRSVAANIAIDASASNPEMLARIMAMLRQLLGEFVARSKSLTGNDVSMASSLIGMLAQLADPQAHDVIAAAFAAELSEMMSEQDVEWCYNQGGWKIQPDADDWLAGYRRDYQRHLDAEQRKTQRPHQPSPLSKANSAVRPAAPSQMPSHATVRVERRIGRNDPCWCGSGKKYKNCHLRLEKP